MLESGERNLVSRNALNTHIRRKNKKAQKIICSLNVSSELINKTCDHKRADNENDKILGDSGPDFKWLVVFVLSSHRLSASHQQAHRINHKNAKIIFSSSPFLTYFRGHKINPWMDIGMHLRIVWWRPREHNEIMTALWSINFCEIYKTSTQFSLSNTSMSCFSFCVGAGNILLTSSLST